jgi:hypothetical protein
MLRRFKRDLSARRREYRELVSESETSDDTASLKLAASARRFSNRAQGVVEDKLSFSATLMRAGEVDAAHRLLAEVERDVRAEEAAFIETVNEVKVGQTARRQRMSRLRLARTMAVSLAGAMLVGFSALGMAATGFIGRGAEAQRGRVTDGRSSARLNEATARARQLEQLGDRVHGVLVAGVRVELTPKEFRAYETMLAGEPNIERLERRLERFLDDKLPTPQLVQKVALHLAEQVERLDAVVAAAPEIEDAAGNAAGAANEVRTSISEKVESSQEGAGPRDEDAGPPAAAEESDKPEGKARGKDKHEKEDSGEGHRGQDGTDAQEDDAPDGPLPNDLRSLFTN